MGRGRIAAILCLVPFLAAPVLDGEITGPEKFSSAACIEGQTWVKGASVWACGASNGRTYLEADVTEATGAAHTTIFTIPLDMVAGKEQVVRVGLIQSSDTATTSAQNRAQISGANAIGTCTFLTALGSSLEFDAIALSTTSADTGNTLGHISTDPFLATIDCAVSASNTNATDLVISFQAEAATNVTTHAGSWYEHISQ